MLDGDWTPNMALRNGSPGDEGSHHNGRARGILVSLVKVAHIACPWPSNGWQSSNQGRKIS